MPCCRRLPRGSLCRTVEGYRQGQTWLRRGVDAGSPARRSLGRSPAPRYHLSKAVIRIGRRHDVQRTHSKRCGRGGRTDRPAGWKRGPCASGPGAGNAGRPGARGRRQGAEPSRRWLGPAQSLRLWNPAAMSQERETNSFNSSSSPHSLTPLLPYSLIPFPIGFLGSGGRPPQGTRVAMCWSGRR